MTASDWIALSSVVIALCAFGASLWQAHATSKHNRLSAKPTLQTNFVVKRDEVHGSLLNVGLGPALLDELRFRFNDREFNFFDDSFNEFLDLFSNPGGNHTDFYVQRVPTGTVIPVGGEFLLFRVLNASKDSEHIERLNAMLPRLQFKSAYRSMYEEHFESS